MSPAQTAGKVVAAIQMNSGASVELNLRAAGELLEAARAQQAGLAVLPENFAFMGAHESDKLRLAEDDGRGPIQDFLGAKAKQLGLWIVAGTIPLKVPGRGDRAFAACLVYDAGGQRVARYDKMHLFDVEVPDSPDLPDPKNTLPGPAPREHSKDQMPRGTPKGREHYRESATIEPGAGNFVIAESPVGALGLTVCYDLRFPELYRGLSAAGAELLLVPSAFTERTGRAHWEVLLRARAIENQCYVIAPDQSGEHPGGRRTWGHSCVVDPWGRILAQRETGEGLALAPIPLAPLRKLRSSFPVLKHRRIDP